MSDSIAKEKVLRAIITALEDKDSFDPQLRAEVEGEYYTPIKPENIPVVFAENFVENGGVFIFCESIDDFYNKLALAAKSYNWNNIFCNKNIIKTYFEEADISYKSDIENHNSFDTSFILCEHLVARHGSIIVSASTNNDIKLLSSSNTLVVIAGVSQINAELKDALTILKDKYINSLPSYISVITGPCKTNSIENKFVVGGQCHKNIFLFLINDKI